VLRFFGAKTNEKQISFQIENRARNHHVIEKAQELRDEQLPEVRPSSEAGGPGTDVMIF
jgi:hypothetical protein